MGAVVWREYEQWRKVEVRRSGRRLSRAAPRPHIFGARKHRARGGLRRRPREGEGNRRQARLPRVRLGGGARRGVPRRQRRGSDRQAHGGRHGALRKKLRPSHRKADLHVDCRRRKNRGGRKSQKTRRAGWPHRAFQPRDEVHGRARPQPALYHRRQARAVQSARNRGWRSPRPHDTRHRRRPQTCKFPCVAHRSRGRGRAQPQRGHRKRAHRL